MSRQTIVDQGSNQMRSEILYDTFFKVLIAVFITKNLISWDSELDSPWGLMRFYGNMIHIVQI